MTSRPLLGLITAPVVLLATGAPLAARAAPCALADLQWMTGAWRDHEARVQTEERWTAGPGGRLIGSSWRLHEDTPGGVMEAMTLTDDAGRLVMRLRHFDSTLAQAREEKDAPMVFVATDCAARAVTLEGTGAQAGERFNYQRLGDELTFVGSFLHAGQPVRAEARFQRVGREK
jgi:hypothetical protein